MPHCVSRSHRHWRKRRLHLLLVVVQEHATSFTRENNALPLIFTFWQSEVCLHTNITCMLQLRIPPTDGGVRSLLFLDNFLLVGTTRCSLLRAHLETEQNEEEGNTSRSVKVVSRDSRKGSGASSTTEAETNTIEHQKKFRGPLKNAAFDSKALTNVLRMS